MTAVLNVRMPKKKPAGESRQPNRKPYKQARIRMPIAEVAESQAESLIQDFNQYVNDAVRMRLEAEGAWPPPPRKPA